MKTDELIALLGTNLEPAKPGQLRNTLLVALGIGAVVAFCLMLAIFGAPIEVFDGEHVALGLLTMTFTLALVAVGGRVLLEAARPGEPGGEPLFVIGALFLTIALLGIGVLALADPAAWGGMLFGPQLTACLFCIPLFAIAPFASLVWTVRGGAPTNLRYAGATTGLVAGALGAAIFAFHHPGGSIPFVAVWYGGSILLCALFGALVGPRLLRW